MKRILILMILITSIGCTNNEEKIVVQNDSNTSYDVVQTTEILTVVDGNDVKEDINNCRLIVNGKDITKDNYVWIDTKNRNTALPLLEISRELGAIVEWQDENIVRIEYKESSETIDKTGIHMGITVPPGTVGSVRKIIGDELVYDSVTLRYFFRNVFNAEINVDYDAMIVYIDSSEE